MWLIMHTYFASRYAYQRERERETEPSHSNWPRLESHRTESTLFFPSSLITSLPRHSTRRSFRSLLSQPYPVHHPWWTAVMHLILASSPAIGWLYNFFAFIFFPSPSDPDRMVMDYLRSRAYHDCAACWGPFWAPRCKPMRRAVCGGERTDSN